MRFQGPDLLSIDLPSILKIPEQVIVVRADALLISRPGAGGYALIASTSTPDPGNIAISGSATMTTTSEITQMLIREAASVIADRSAVIITRSDQTSAAMAKAFGHLPLIRVIGHNPVLTADATRLAHVAAVTARISCQPDRTVMRMPSRPIGTKAGKAFARALEGIISSGDGKVTTDAMRHHYQRMLDAATAMERARLTEEIRKTLEKSATPVSYMDETLSNHEDR